MPEVDVTARAGCIYRSQPRPEGEVFACDLADARMLRTIGKVEFEDTPTHVRAEPSSKHLKADGSPDRRYQRRDMVAED